MPLVERAFAILFDLLGRLKRIKIPSSIASMTPNVSEHSSDGPVRHQGRLYLDAAAPINFDWESSICYYFNRRSPLWNSTK
jgi:hypothetical protein